MGARPVHPPGPTPMVGGFMDVPHQPPNLCCAMRCAMCCVLWQAVEIPLKISQTAAIMEVVHAAAGIVKSPVAITGRQ